MNKQWEELANYFLGLINHPRYGAHASEMFKLILVLREEKELADTNVSADYLYITFRRDGVAGSILVSNESAGFFTVSVRRGEDKTAHFQDDHNVALEYVCPLLIYHLDRMHETALPTRS